MAHHIEWTEDLNRFQISYLSWLEKNQCYLTYKITREILDDCDAITGHSKEKIESRTVSDADRLGSDTDMSPTKGDSELGADWKRFVGKLKHTLNYHMKNLSARDRVTYARVLCRSATVSILDMKAWNVIA